MSLFTLSAPVCAWALFSEVAWFQAVETQLIVADSGHHLVSRHGLELGTGEQRVPFSLADNTSVGNTSSECC